jgi:hypothetical protein
MSRISVNDRGTISCSLELMIDARGQLSTETVDFCERDDAACRVLDSEMLASTLRHLAKRGPEGLLLSNLVID